MATDVHCSKQACCAEPCTRRPAPLLPLTIRGRRGPGPPICLERSPLPKKQLQPQGLLPRQQGHGLVGRALGAAGRKACHAAHAAAAQRPRAERPGRRTACLLHALRSLLRALRSLLRPLRRLLRQLCRQQGICLLVLRHLARRLALPLARYQHC